MPFISTNGKVETRLSAFDIVNSRHLPPPPLEAFALAQKQMIFMNMS